MEHGACCRKESYLEFSPKSWRTVKRGIKHLLSFQCTTHIQTLCVPPNAKSTLKRVRIQRNVALLIIVILSLVTIGLAVNMYFNPAGQTSQGNTLVYALIFDVN